jgi:hypothetical protein
VSEWLAPTLENGWSNIGGTSALAGYIRAGNVVSLRGAVQGGTTVTAAIFMLPVGYRPPARQYFAVTIDGNQPGTVRVNPEGHVIALTSTATQVALDGITFRVS